MRRWILALLLVELVAVSATRADPVKVRFPEGPAHGFVTVTDTSDRPLASGELVQWLEKNVIVSELTFEFDDGSRYREIVRFTQDRVFRLISYRLIQKGPSFTTSGETYFEQKTGRYKVHLQDPDGKSQEASGTTKIPADVSNGMTSIMIRNAPPSGKNKTHLIVFNPDPHVLEVSYDDEGTVPFWVNAGERTATRVRITPKVTGVTGAVATVIGKQPDPFYMWMATGKVPVLQRFEGQLYADGPVWRIGPAAPRFKK